MSPSAFDRPLPNSKATTKQNLSLPPGWLTTPLGEPPNVAPLHQAFRRLAELFKRLLGKAHG